MSPTTKHYLEEIAERLGLPEDKVIDRILDMILQQSKPSGLGREEAGGDPIAMVLSKLMDKIDRGEDISLKDLALLQYLQNLQSQQPRSGGLDLQQAIGAAILWRMFSEAQPQQSKQDQGDMLVKVLEVVMGQRKLEDLLNEIRKTREDLAKSMEEKLKETHSRIDYLTAMNQMKKGEEKDFAKEIGEEVMNALKDKLRDMVKSGLLKEEEVMTPEGKIRWDKVINRVIGAVETLAKAYAEGAKQPVAVYPPTPPPGEYTYQQSEQGLGKVEEVEPSQEPQESGEASVGQEGEAEEASGEAVEGEPVSAAEEGGSGEGSGGQD